MGASPENIADLDGDGALDLWTLYTRYDAQSQTSPALMVYYNDGTGTSFDRELYEPESNYGNWGWRGSNIADDLDGDGDTDILFYWNGRFLLFENQGGRLFTLQQTNIADGIGPVGFLDYSVEFIRAELLTDHDVLIFINDRLFSAVWQGPGSYTVHAVNQLYRISGFGRRIMQTPRPSGGAPMTLLLSADGVVAAFDTAPDGSLVTAPLSDAAFVRASVVFALQKLSPTAESRTGVTIRRSFGYAYSRSEVITYREESPETVSSLRAPVSHLAWRDGYQSSLLPPVDLDGDGDLDLPFLGNWRIHVLINDGTDHFQNWVTIYTPAGWGIPTAVRDFNNDGKADVLFLGGSARRGIILNASTAPFGPPAEVDLDADGVPDRAEPAEILDFDGDRRSDRVVLRPSAGALLWYISRSTAPSDDPVPLILGRSIDEPVAADYNGDGRIDPAIVMQLNGALVWRTNVDGVVEDRIFGRAGDTVLTGRLDGDRKADRVVVRRSRGKLIWFFERGGNVSSVIWGASSDHGFLGDANSDGVDELIVARTTRSGVTWYPLTLSGQVVGQRQFGNAGDTLLPPYIEARHGLNFAVARPWVQPWQGRIYASASSVFDCALGDSVYLASYSGLRDPRPGARHDLLSTVALQGSYEEGAYVIPRTVRESYGLVGDLTLGSDGKIAPRISGPGGLTCDSVETLAYGSSPAWFPLGMQQNSPRPEFVLLPSQRAAVSSLTLFTRSGVALDRLKAVRRSPSYRTARITLAQILGIDPVYGPVVQARLRNRKSICWPVPVVDQAWGSGF